MPQLYKQKISHTLHIYRLNMKNVNISLTTITYKTHINIVLSTMMRCCSRRLKKKGKAIPLQAWTGPEGSRRLWLPDFKTVGT
jgi:hypothetical protein